MLRISVTTSQHGATVTLEGRLVGPWVGELARSWGNVSASHGARSVRVDLDAVTFIDAAGKVLLQTMREQGATLLASGCMTRAVLEEIERKGPR